MKTTNYQVSLKSGETWKSPDGHTTLVVTGQNESFAVSTLMSRGISGSAWCRKNQKLSCSDTKFTVIALLVKLSGEEACFEVVETLR